MNIDIRDFYYRESIGRDNEDLEIMSDDKVAYEVTLSNTYWDCKDELEAKALLILELIELRKELVNEINNRKRKQR